jgi:hypothetical protein
MTPTSRKPARTAMLAAVLGTLAIPAMATASASVDLGAQAWSGGASGGFALSGATLVSAVAGTYASGSDASFSWCDPYANSSISSAVVNAMRGQAASPVAISVGPSATGAGGLTRSDSQIAAASPGTNLALGGLSTQCIGAAVNQTQTAASGARRWTLALGDVTLNDNQGPAVTNETIRGTEVNGWITSPITVFWSASDNQLLRGTTGVQVSDGPSQSLGDAPDSTELSSVVDPGADGTHTVTVYRTAGGGWPTAEASTVIHVDRTPPTVPQVVSPPEGTYPVPLAATPSNDGLSGSGVARIEFTDDGGRTRLGGTSMTAPGTYEVQARAIDVAGNASSWSSPIQLVVPAGGAGGSGVRGVHLAHIRVAGRATDASGTITLARTWGQFIAVDATLANGLGAPARAARVVLSDGHGVLAVGSTNSAGRILLRLPVRRSGSVALTAGGGALAHIELRMRPLLLLDPAIRHAIAGRPLTLNSRRVLSVAGTAAPGHIVIGQPVELEYLLGRTWVPLGLPTAVSRSGHWRVTYTVSRPGSATVRMRVLMPSQPGLPFAASVTPAFRVAIR